MNVEFGHGGEIVGGRLMVPKVKESDEKSSALAAKANLA